MSTIEERLINALAEVIDEHTYSERYLAEDKCSCCHQDIRRHEDSCAIPLLQSIRNKLMEGTE